MVVCVATGESRSWWVRREGRGYRPLSTAPTCCRCSGDCVCHPPSFLGWRVSLLVGVVLASLSLSPLYLYCLRVSPLLRKPLSFTLSHIHPLLRCVSLGRK